MTSETFFTELNKLLSRFPQVPPEIVNSENSDYGQNLYYCQNQYICFDNAHCSDCIYVYDSYIAKNCMDCDYAVETELCYESVDPVNCFNGDYLEYCTSVRDAFYSANCINCNDIFGCVNLTSKSFCIFNRQLSEAEYREKVELYKKWPAERVLSMVEELKKRYPLTQTHEGHNEHSAYGNYIHYNKNCYLCFDAGHNENCGYLYDSFYNKTCYDMTYASQHNQLSCQIIDSANLFNCNYAVLSSSSDDSSYIFNCRNVKDCLGCVSLSNKQYCILNRQFSKERYEEVSKQILKELTSKNLSWANVTF